MQSFSLQYCDFLKTKILNLNTKSQQKWCKRQNLVAAGQIEKLKRPFIHSLLSDGQKSYWKSGWQSSYFKASKDSTKNHIWKILWEVAFFYIFFALENLCSMRSEVWSEVGRDFHETGRAARQWAYLYPYVLILRAERGWKGGDHEPPFVGVNSPISISTFFTNVHNLCPKITTATVCAHCTTTMDEESASFVSSLSNPVNKPYKTTMMDLGDLDIGKSAGLKSEGNSCLE